jgi:hypothetical protein
MIGPCTPRERSLPEKSQGANVTQRAGMGFQPVQSRERPSLTDENTLVEIGSAALDAPQSGSHYVPAC